MDQHLEHHPMSRGSHFIGLFVTFIKYVIGPQGSGSGFLLDSVKVRWWNLDRGQPKGCFRSEVPYSANTGSVYGSADMSPRQCKSSALIAIYIFIHVICQ